MRDDLLIKICGITNEADALLAVGLGADALGFVLAPSPRQIAPSLAGDVVKRIPHGVLTVGVFRDEAPMRVVEIANTVGFGAVQLHGHETVEQCLWIRERVACTIRAFTAGDRAISRFLEFGADFLLIDGQSPGSGQVFDWRLAEGVVDPGRMFVSGGLTPENVGDAISALRPRGVDVSSGVESAPGAKDPQKLRAFVRNARAAAPGSSGEPGATRGGSGLVDGTGPWGPSSELGGADGHEDPYDPYDWMQG
ncbi:MAG: phosphoribosylanthranilate isomerase [Acidimicrobiales bacterium]